MKKPEKMRKGILAALLLLVLAAAFVTFAPRTVGRSSPASPSTRGDYPSTFRKKMNLLDAMSAALMNGDYGDYTVRLREYVDLSFAGRKHLLAYGYTMLLVDEMDRAAAAPSEKHYVTGMSFWDTNDLVLDIVAEPSRFKELVMNSGHRVLKLILMDKMKELNP